VSALFGAVIGAALSFFGLRHQARQQADLEARRWDWQRQQEEDRRVEERKEERRRDAKLALAELAKRLAMSAHSMAWVTWIARHDPEHFPPQLIKDHDRRMYSLYAQLTAAQVQLGAFDREFFFKSLALVEKVKMLDAEIALLARDLSRNLGPLGDVWSKITRLETEISEGFLGALEKESLPLPTAPAP
jgi:hypothetical protein